MLKHVTHACIHARMHHVAACSPMCRCAVAAMPASAWRWSGSGKQESKQPAVRAPMALGATGCGREGQGAGLGTATSRRAVPGFPLPPPVPCTAVHSAVWRAVWPTLWMCIVSPTGRYHVQASFKESLPLIIKLVEKVGPSLPPPGT